MEYNLYKNAVWTGYRQVKILFTDNNSTLQCWQINDSTSTGSKHIMNITSQDNIYTYTYTHGYTHASLATYIHMHIHA